MNKCDIMVFLFYSSETIFWHLRSVVSFSEDETKKKKKKRNSDDEAFEESDDGDEEGRELDYISDSSDRFVMLWQYL